MIQFLKKYYGVNCFILVIIIPWLANLVSPTGFYKVYSSIFTMIRFVYDYTLGFLPFASFYILLIGVCLACYSFFKISLCHKVQYGLKSTIGFVTLKAVNTLLLFAGLFYLLWGYNYHRPRLLDTQQWSEVSMDSTLLMRELIKVTQKLNDYHLKDSGAKNELNSWTDIENEVRLSQINLLQSWHYPTPGKVRIRPLYPKGSLLRISTAGFYNPFSFEGHVDPGLNSLQWPFTIAHEMAHGYGFTDEGECNFIGLVSCVTSKNKSIQYSGWISYWRYLYYDAKSSYPHLAEQCFASLHDGVVKDLKAIRYDSQKYPDIFPFVRDFIYDFYLKLHGMEDGLASYNDISKLMISYETSQKTK